MLWRKSSAWHCAVLVENKCSWDDPSVQFCLCALVCCCCCYMAIGCTWFQRHSNVPAGCKHNNHGCPAMFRLVWMPQSLSWCLQCWHMLLCCIAWPTIRVLHWVLLFHWPVTVNMAQYGSILHYINHLSANDAFMCHIHFHLKTTFSGNGPKVWKSPGM